MKYVLYHGNCYDGFGAAYSAWKALGNEPTYIPVSYGQPPPKMPDAKEIYILDFCYEESVLLELSKTAQVVVLDHHKTAFEKLKNLLEKQEQEFDHNSKLLVEFNMEQSGALMAWKFFNQTPVPMLIQHISDRDLWQFKLDGTSKVHKALVSYPMEFELWDSFDVEKLKIEGEVCERIYTQLVENICSKSWKTKIGDYVVPVVNTSIAWSEVGDTLVKMFPDAPFVASFTNMPNGVMWSLRSRSDFDVSEIAKQFGGGGHKNAAGFKTPRI